MEQIKLKIDIFLQKNPSRLYDYNQLKMVYVASCTYFSFIPGLVCAAFDMSPGQQYLLGIVWLLLIIQEAMACGLYWQLGGMETGQVPAIGAVGMPENRERLLFAVIP